MTETSPESPAPPQPADAADVHAAARLAGLDFTDEEVDLMVGGVGRNLSAYERMREHELTNDVPSVLQFRPRGRVRSAATAPWDATLPDVERPDELAWADIPTLASLVRSRRVSCVELAELSLARLERLDPVLHCVVTLTRERALERARSLDGELASGRWRGPLHGIPWGAKDLLAVRGYPTTWGAPPFRGQVIDADATVVSRLDDAGAVLVAKLSLGELAMGDTWFGGRTNNPWSPEHGSSGSSAGSASAVAAGCVPFAIGSETLGSILSPSATCGCSSLRPTYGAVSRHGAMSLAPSMDKLGPICRSVFDAAIVFDAIRGPDGLDDTVADASYAVPASIDIRGSRVGYLATPFERAPETARVLEELRALGAELVPVDLPPIDAQALMPILSAEAAASFDELTRDGRDDELVQQGEHAWPTSFRVARLIPAVEYLRANRIRTQLMRGIDDVFEDIDAYVHPALTSRNLVATNLTGHPACVAPCGRGEDALPLAIAFTGTLYGEARLLAIADAWQRSTGHHLEHPKDAR